MDARPAPAPHLTTWLPLLAEALAREGRFIFPLRGDSMRPTLPAICDIEVRPIAEPLPLGSLIVFAAGDALVAHRLVRRAGGWLIAQGDGRLAADPRLRSTQVLGQVVTASHQGVRCWPRRGERWLRWLWLIRHHLLRAPWALYRRIKRMVRGMAR